MKILVFIIETITNINVNMVLDFLLRLVGVVAVMVVSYREFQMAYLPVLCRISRKGKKK